MKIPEHSQERWMQELDETPETKAMGRARRFLVQARLAQFVQRSNCQGFAPDVGQINAHLIRLSADAQASDTDLVYAVTLSKQPNRSKWKKKWGLGFGTPGLRVRAAAPNPGPPVPGPGSNPGIRPPAVGTGVPAAVRGRAESGRDNARRTLAWTQRRTQNRQGPHLLNSLPSWSA